MEFRDDALILDKPPNGLDELVLDVTGILDRVGIEYVVVSGYVAVLLGRARATEDIDVITDRFDESTADDLVDGLQDAGYWGSAMSLDRLYETLSDGLPVRIAEEGHRVPSVECKFAADEYDKASLHDTLAVRLGGEEFVIGSLELQIAYKLDMGAERDYEDALYLHELLEPTLNTSKLESYVERLGVEAEYDELKRT
ncbi:hypothetical protein [Halococcus saccharolyticus]|uniref:Nucleotidyltransferase n=1 Tax=Halococcus saccharolyticus DSM 5350 TaxID=1227455 RepID=M0MF75_9EURY|nr:hypothetical protein [Halococcus saccharolyticus]EMA43344.1 hypothetical protein C449_15237 [Halococcus saccharolyticus DSM 5350]